MPSPSLQVVSNSGPLNTAFKVRGVGNDPNIPNFEPAVGLFIDGVFMPRSGLGLGDLVDIERIEILKGPQSTLYGKNVTAGLIHVITKKNRVRNSRGKLRLLFHSLDGAKKCDRGTICRRHQRSYLREYRCWLIWCLL